MRAQYHVPFEDIDYESWLKKLGLEGTLTPSPDGGFILSVEGTQENIDKFSNELSYGPMEF